MLESLEALFKSIPLIGSYPWWIKGLFSLFVMSGAALIIGLAVSKPTSTVASNMPPTAASPSTPSDTRTWMKFFGLTMYGDFLGQRHNAKIVFKVNGLDFTYPEQQTAEWVEISSDMPQQIFELPTADEYDIQIKVYIEHGDEFNNLEHQIVLSRDLPALKQYDVRVFHQRTKGAVGGSVRYGISHLR